MRLFHVNCRGCNSLAWITSSAKRPLSALWKDWKTIVRIYKREVEETGESNQDKPINSEVFWLHIFHEALKRKSSPHICLQPHEQSWKKPFSISVFSFWNVGWTLAAAIRSSQETFLKVRRRISGFFLIEMNSRNKYKTEREGKWIKIKLQWHSGNFFVVQRRKLGKVQAFSLKTVTAL